ncbi:MAG TPA: hypothetical protein VMT10_03555 [Solirubrobacteraceae bacterium]|nr:hypothetical protein [Solirubrobacteraceae bacterium]
MLRATTSRLAAPLVAVVALLIGAPAALAHGGNPNYRSVFTGVTPHAFPGVQVQVLGYDQNYQVTNKSGKLVVIKGYQNEPYARLLPDGTVEVNHNSPAFYLNADRYATATVPSYAKASAPPDWRVIDRTGQFIWHDHRMHWMSTSRPPAVKDAKKKTKIFDYAIPISVGGTAGAIHGTLWWVGPAGGGLTTGAIAAFLALAVAGVALVVVVRRRRAARAGGTHGADAASGEPGAGSGRGGAEAW